MNSNVFHLKYKGKIHDFVEKKNPDENSYYSYVYRRKKYIGRTNNYPCSIGEMGDAVKACDFVTCVHRDVQEPIHDLLGEILN